MAMEAVKNNQLFFAGMVASMACWGFSWTSGKILSAYGDPANISLLRFGVTFVSLVVLLPFTRQEIRIKTEGFRDLILASLCIAIYTWLFFKGLKTGKAGAGGILVTTINPVISYAIMLAVNRRKPTSSEVLGILLGLAAGIILLQLWKQTGNIFAEGNLYFVLASFTWAVLSLFTARSSRYGSPMAFSMWMYGICCILMILIAGGSDWIIILSAGDFPFWFNLVFSATITTALATTFYFFATAKIGAGKASSFIFMVPLSAALGSWLFLQEIPQMHTVMGGVLGVMAVYIINKK